LLSGSEKVFNGTIQKYVFSDVCCIAVYWLSNSILWVPWKYAPWLGAICMLVYVPIVWGGISFLSLEKFAENKRKKAKYILGTSFAVIAFFSDFIFYVGYRHVPEQLFKPATFGAYILCFIAPVLVGTILQKKKIQSAKSIRLVEWVMVSLAAIIFILITFFVSRFW
jgi:hypothetical protein